MELVNFHSHVASMKEQGRTLSGFTFIYNKHDCIAVLSIAEQDLRKDRQAICMVRVFKDGNLEDCFECFCRSRWLNIPNPIDLYRFFEIDRNTSKESHFKDLLKGLLRVMEGKVPSKFKELVIRKIDQAILQVINNDPVDPDGKYCFGMKENGVTKKGDQIYRSDYNDEKTRRKRPELYERFGLDRRISFCYSDDPTKEKSDWEIAHNFFTNKPNYKIVV